MLTLLVAAVVLSLLDHFVGFLSGLVLKRLVGRRASEEGRNRGCCRKSRKAATGVHREFPANLQSARGGHFAIVALKANTQSADPHQVEWGTPKSSTATPQLKFLPSSIKRIFTTSTDC